MKNHSLLVTFIASGLALAAIGCGSSSPATGGTGGAGGANALCAMKPPATAVISDFTTGTTAGVNAQQGRTGGWYIYYQGDGSDPSAPAQTGTLTPPKSTNGIPRDNTMGGPCSGPGSLHQAAMGVTGYGVGIGTNLASAVANKHGTYDASAYAGVRLFMKCAMETQHVLVKLPTGDTDFDAASPKCTGYGDCNAHGIFGQTIGTDWTKLELPFDTITQDPGQTGTTSIPTFDKSKITAIQLQVNSNYDAAMVASPNNFDCYIDDVYFY